MLAPGCAWASSLSIERKWVVAVYLITVFIVLPALVIILVGVL
jgi:hypothetical protein